MNKRARIRSAQSRAMCHSTGDEGNTDPLTLSQGCMGKRLGGQKRYSVLEYVCVRVTREFCYKTHINSHRTTCTLQVIHTSPTHVTHKAVIKTDISDQITPVILIALITLYINYLYFTIT